MAYDGLMQKDVAMGYWEKAVGMEESLDREYFGFIFSPPVRDFPSCI